MWVYLEANRKGQHGKPTIVYMTGWVKPLQGPLCASAGRVGVGEQRLSRGGDTCRPYSFFRLRPPSLLQYTDHHLHHHAYVIGCSGRSDEINNRPPVGRGRSVRPASKSPRARSHCFWPPLCAHHAPRAGT